MKSLNLSPKNSACNKCLIAAICKILCYERYLQACEYSNKKPVPLEVFKKQIWIAK